MTYVKSLSEGHGYRESGDVFWKELDDYLVTMTEHDRKVYVDVRSGLEQDLMPMAVGEAIAAISEQENVHDCMINKASILLSIEGEVLTSEAVEALVQEIVSILKDHSIPGLIKCELCKTDFGMDGPIVMKVNHKLMRAHKHCYEKFVDDLEEAKNNPKGSIIMGVIGAVLFGAIGTLPWIIVGILGWFASILGMVIGISANYGYQKFGGKQGKIKAYTLVAVLILMVVGAGFVTQLYELFQYLNAEGVEGVSIIDGLRFILMLLQEDSEFLGSFLLNTAMGVAFGLFGSWRIIKASGNESTLHQLHVELASE